MEILQKPTYQEVCDLVQAITGSYESIVEDLDASFANKVSGKTHSRFESPLEMALNAYQSIADAYTWSHMLDCTGCSKEGTNYSQFWGQYYTYSKNGCTKKKIDSEWPDGSEEQSNQFIESRQQYRSIFPHICELYASGMSYEEAIESAEKSVQPQVTV
jgi:hypothetical protein